jgi:hypothetical protein
VVSNSLSKPVFPAMSIRPTTNYIASSFSWLHCSTLAVLSVVRHTLDITEGNERFIPVDYRGHLPQSFDRSHPQSCIIECDIRSVTKIFLTRGSKVKCMGRMLLDIRVTGLLTGVTFLLVAQSESP